MTSIDAAQAEPRFQPVLGAFHTYLEDPSFSAQLAVYHRGQLVLDVAGGPHVTRTSLTGVFSATKGVAALTLGHVLDRYGIELERPVSRLWPEFGARGKEDVTIAQLLAHQAGLPAIETVVPLEELVRSELAAGRLASQLPVWMPGTAFGYHAITIGVLMEELVRRITGTSLQTIYESEVRGPRDLEFFLGLPAERDGEYVPIQPVLRERAAEQQEETREALRELIFYNFDAGDDLSATGVSPNNAQIRRSGPSAIGGVGSARGLAGLYRHALPDSPDPLVQGDVLERMAIMRSWGTDRVLNCPNAFGCVFMVPSPRLPFGSHRAFGHDGAGGALAFADPITDVAFGYVPVPMQPPGGADPRALRLATMVRDIAAS